MNRVLIISSFFWCLSLSASSQMHYIQNLRALAATQKKLIDAQPDNSEALLVYAHTLFLLNETEAALETCLQSLERHTTVTGLLFLAQLTIAHTGQHHNALKILNRITAPYSDHTSGAIPWVQDKKNKKKIRIGSAPRTRMIPVDDDHLEHIVMEKLKQL